MKLVRCHLHKSKVETCEKFSLVYFLELKLKLVSAWVEAHFMIALAYQVKTQYLPIYNKVDTSIKHQISDQSTTMVKGCMYRL